jgi:hypothetical protein
MATIGLTDDSLGARIPDPARPARGEQGKGKQATQWRNFGACQFQPTPRQSHDLSHAP